MPSVELKSSRNRKRGRSRLHVSSSAHSPTSPIPPVDTQIATANSSHPTVNITTSTPGSSSSDERHEKSPSASSLSSSSFFDDEHWRRAIRKRGNGLNDTVWWGYFLLLTTWIVFVLGIGGVCGVWEWSLKPIRTDTKHKVVLSLRALWFLADPMDRSLKVMRH